MSSAILLKIKPEGISYSLDDSYNQITKYVMNRQYILDLKSCPGFLGFRTDENIECELCSLCDDSIFMVYSSKPFYVAFDTEDNALLYKLSI